MNPRDMKKLMKQMNVEEIPAEEVIIVTADKELVFSNPKVSKMTVMGQETYQVLGIPVERPLEAGAEDIEADLEMVMDKTGVDLQEARRALGQANGDIAQAIIDLTQ